MTPKREMRTDIGWSDASRITVFGHDFPSEILGRLNLGDMGFLELTGRIPNANESRMFNAMVVTLVEHGITPSALAARLTYLGAPESMQAAVAAGLCGLGSVFVGSIEGCAKMLYDAMPVCVQRLRATASFVQPKSVSTPSTSTPIPFAGQRVTSFTVPASVRTFQRVLPARPRLVVI